MDDFQKRAEALFFSNSKRGYYNSPKQRIYTDSCSTESDKLGQEFKRLVGIKCGNEKLFDTVIGDKVVAARRRIAEAQGENRYGLVGMPVSQCDHDIGQYHCFNVDQKDRQEFLDLIENNVEKTKLLSISTDVFLQSDKYRMKMSSELSPYGMFGRYYVEADHYSDKSKCQITYPTFMDSELKKKTGELLKSAINWKKTDGEAALHESIAKLRWNIIVARYFVASSSSISDLLEASLYKQHDFAIFPRKEDYISRDIKCFLSPCEEVYAENYLKDFHDRYKPQPKEHLTKAMNYGFDKTFTVTQLS
jgi:hypothetical protein